jgi:uncharacterized PurR-regulated membrane protein YhhQ (DUF165 family)
VEEISGHTNSLHQCRTTSEFNITARSKKHFTIASFAMALILAASNYLVEIPIGNWLTWGAFTYPFSFLASELMNRFYGAHQARQVVYVGFLVAVILAFSWMNPRIAIASSTAFLMGQLLDISVFNRFRKRSWWIAPGLASVSASIVDTLIFFSIAFAGTTVPWIQLAVGDLCIKLVMDLGLLLPFKIALWRKPQLI